MRTQETERRSAAVAEQRVRERERNRNRLGELRALLEGCDSRLLSFTGELDTAQGGL